MDGNGFNQDPNQQNGLPTYNNQPNNFQQGGDGQDPFAQNNFQQQGFNQQNFQQQQMGYQGQFNGGYQPGYDQQGYNQQYIPPQQQDPTPGFSIAALVTGILALLLACCLNKWDLIFALPAIVFGILGLKKEPNGKGMAIAGIVLGAIALIIIIVIIIIAVAIVNQAASLGAAGWQAMMEQIIENALENQ